MSKQEKKPRAVFVPKPDEIIRVFRNSMAYEIMFTFGVPTHDPTDYFQWEMINFTRLAHARVLYYFFETSIRARQRKMDGDDVVSEDFDFPAQSIPLPAADRPRVNKDLMHLTYARLRHSPESKPWPDSILACLLCPVLSFMEHVKNRSELFENQAAIRRLAQFD